MTRTEAALLLAWALSACSGDAGALATPCRPDGTCQVGLVCDHGVCLTPEPPMDASAAMIDGGAPRDGGDAIDASRLDAGEALEDAGPEPSRDAAVLDGGELARDAGGVLEWDAALVPPTPPPPAESSGPIAPPPGPRTCTIPGHATDHALDWERHRVVSTRGWERAIDRVDLTTCELTTITLAAGYPEHVRFDPYRDEIVVTIVASLSDFDRPDEGSLLVLDALDGTVRATHPLALGPWHVVSDGRGYAYVTATRTGRFARVDLESGETLVAPGYFSAGTDLALHPARNRAYGAASTLVRLGLGERTGESFRSSGPGARHTCGQLRVDPRGRTIHTACGDVFVATDVAQTDMTWVGSLGRGWRDLAFHPEGDVAYVLGDAPEVDVYDTATLTRLRTVPLSTSATRIFAAHEYAVVVHELPYPRATRIEVRARAGL